MWEAEVLHEFIVSESYQIVPFESKTIHQNELYSKMLIMIHVSSDSSRKYQSFLQL